MAWIPTPPSPGSADPAAKDPKYFDPNRPLAKELETSLDTSRRFTVAAVGDCIISRPLSGYRGREPGFAKLLDLLTTADCVYGNMETVIFDPRYFDGHPYAWDGDWPLVSTPDVAADLAKMRFNVFSRANNHALDWGLEGMRESSRWLDSAGLVHAGVGESLGRARAAAYFESALGRVGIVSCCSTYRDTTNALPENDAAPGRPGLSNLGVDQTIVVSPEVLAELRRLRDRVPAGADTRRGLRGDGAERDELRLAGSTLVAGEDDAAAGYRYTMRQGDLWGILRAIRQGKEHSDFLIATIHSHEPASDALDPMPADFLKAFGEAAIAAGADMVITTGIHHAQPVGIYNNRPIFYGLGNFFWSDIQEPLPTDLFAGNEPAIVGAFGYPVKVTDPDLSNMMNAGAGKKEDSFNTFETFTSVLTMTAFEQNRLREVRLYPIQMGWPLTTLTRSGIPRLADKDTAQTILTRLGTRCQQYGTKLETQGFQDTLVGVITA